MHVHDTTVASSYFHYHTSAPDKTAWHTVNVIQTDKERGGTTDVYTYIPTQISVGCTLISGQYKGVSHDYIFQCSYKPLKYIWSWYEWLDIYVRTHHTVTMAQLNYKKPYQLKLIHSHLLNNNIHKYVLCTLEYENGFVNVKGKHSLGLKISCLTSGITCNCKFRDLARICSQCTSIDQGTDQSKCEATAKSSSTKDPALSMTREIDKISNEFGNQPTPVNRQAASADWGTHYKRQQITSWFDSRLQSHREWKVEHWS